jgi:PEP-CTERM motif
LGVELKRMGRHSTKKNEKSNPMKKLTKVAIVFGFTLAVASSTSFAQFTFTIDEFGVGSFGGAVVPSTIGLDPSGGVVGPVLIYTLPFAVTPGDVILSEPGQVPPLTSDIIRFWNSAAGNQSEIIFYSDFSAADPADAPADVGLPTQLFNPTTITEVGPEGNNGAIYNALPGMPGSTSAPIQYVIISDVPEPGTGALLLSGVGLLFGIRRFRRKGLSFGSSLKS